MKLPSPISSSNRRSHGLAATALALLLTPLSAQQEVPSVAGGGVLIDLRARAKTYISLPYEKTPTDAAALTGATADSLTIGRESWIPGEFAASASGTPRFYITFLTGELAGSSYAVSDNTADTLWLETEGDDLLAHPRGELTIGDVFKIVSFWTLGDLLGRTEAELAITPAKLPFIKGDTVRATTAGREATYRFVKGSGWSLVGGGLVDPDAVLLPLGSAMEVDRAASTNAVSVFNAGRELLHPAMIFVYGGTGTASATGLHAFPAGGLVTLSQAHFVNAADPRQSVVVPKSAALGNGDQLIVPYIDPVKGPLKLTLQYVEPTGWRIVSPASTLDPNTLPLKGGSGFEIRKLAQNPGVEWNPF